MLLYIRFLREGNFHGILNKNCTIDICFRSHTLLKMGICTHPGHELAFIKYPTIFTEFCAGKFIVYKTSNKFSAIAIDQYHEQEMPLTKTLLEELLD